MSNYRRAWIPGGTFFFTVKTENNAPLFNDKRCVSILGQVFREVKVRWQFEINALVLLPDHLHTIWSLPAGDCDFPRRWGWIKKEFTKRHLQLGGREQATSNSRRRYRRRGVWQRRYWEHTIEDESDYQRHFDYIHWNPVKHGYVDRPVDWPHSSLHRWIADGVYEVNWGCGGCPMQTVSNSKHDFGE